MKLETKAQGLRGSLRILVTSPSVTVRLCSVVLPKA